MVKWEYLVGQVKNERDDHMLQLCGYEGQDLGSLYDALGQQGWEFCGKDDCFNLVFKRVLYSV